VVRLPLGLMVVPLGVVTLPSGWWMVPSGVVTLPSGLMVVPLGVVRLPFGLMVVPVAVVTLPSAWWMVPAGSTERPLVPPPNRRRRMSIVPIVLGSFVAGGRATIAPNASRDSWGILVMQFPQLQDEPSAGVIALVCAGGTCRPQTCQPHTARHQH